MPSRKGFFFFRVVIFVSLIAQAAALLAILRPMIPVRLFLPLIVRLFSSSHEINAATISRLEGLVRGAGTPMLAIGFGMLLYSVIGILFLHRLPPEQTERQEQEPDPPFLKVEWVLFVCFLVLALFLRLHAMQRELSYDEIYATLNFIDVRSLVPTIFSFNYFANHLACSILARLSQLIFGHNETALRLPSLLIGLSTFFALWIFGRRYFGRAIALAACLCLAIFPQHVIHSTSVRGYAGMILFSLLSNLFFLRLLDRPSKHDARLYVLVSVVAIYFHLHATFTIIVQMLFLFLLSCRQLLAKQRAVIDCERFRLLWTGGACIAGLSLLLYSPVLLTLFRYMHQRGRKPFEVQFPVTVVQHLLGPIPLALFFLALVGFALFRLFQQRRIVAEYFLLLLVLPFLVLWLSSPRDTQPRFFLFTMPYLLLLFVFGVSELSKINLPDRWVTSTFRIAASAGVIGLLCVWTINSWRGMQQLGFRDAGIAMKQNLDPSTTLCAIGNGAPLYQYYTQTPLLILYSRQEVEAQAAKSKKLRCVALSFDWDPVSRDILEFFTKNGQVRKYKKSYLFMYPAKEQPL